MNDNFGRCITYLRISVTDRCNLRCCYCMPQEGIKLISHENILSFDEIAETVREAVKLGVTKIKITGGEPLVRKGITGLVNMLAQIDGITDLGMTTNGTLLDKYAFALKSAGLHRLNISLDAIDPERYRSITRCSNIEDVMRGIAAAKDAGFSKIKINTVIDASPDEADARAVAEFAAKNNLEIRYIRRMDLEKGEFWVVHGGSGGDCKKCSRLRLTSSGFVRPCLFSDIGFSVRELGATKALTQAIEYKPEKGKISTVNTFYNLGG